MKGRGDEIIGEQERTLDHKMLERLKILQLFVLTMNIHFNRHSPSTTIQTFVATIIGAIQIIFKAVAHNLECQRTVDAEKLAKRSETSC